jgi:sulfoacetaldehyde dehydrogenase
MAVKGGNAIVSRRRLPGSVEAGGRRHAGEPSDWPADLARSCRRRPRATTQPELRPRHHRQRSTSGSVRSGKPALGVGLGNVPVIIDASADLDDAAHKIMLSKTFDHATSCSSENAVVIVDAVYDQAIAALERQGGYLASGAERQRIVERYGRTASSTAT